MMGKKENNMKLKQVLFSLVGMFVSFFVLYFLVALIPGSGYLLYGILFNLDIVPVVYLFAFPIGIVFLNIVLFCFFYFVLQGNVDSRIIFFKLFFSLIGSFVLFLLLHPLLSLFVAREKLLYGYFYTQGIYLMPLFFVSVVCCGVLASFISYCINKLS